MVTVRALVVLAVTCGSAAEQAPAVDVELAAPEPAITAKARCGCPTSSAKTRGGHLVHSAPIDDIVID